jgi:arsenite-transporting ATPase
MRLVLYTGKGGVGKTTTAAATAVLAAERGVRTLVLSADPAHSLGDVFDQRLGPAPREISPGLHAMEVDARIELARHWSRIHDYLVALFRFQGIEEVVAEELALLPGAEELATLTVVETQANTGRYDLVVVDCAPTDATLRLVTLPDVARSAFRILLKMQRAVAAVVTPLAAGIVPVPLPGSGVFRDAERLLYQTLRTLRARLSGPETSVRMVVTPERMVIAEARRAFTDLSLFDLACDLVVMNRVLPETAAQEDFFRDWGRIARERLSEVEEYFAPVEVLPAPLQRDEVVGLERLSAHGRSIFQDRDPAARFATSSRIRFERAASGYRVRIPLPGASARELDVSMVEDELVVKSGRLRRSLRLPGRIASCVLAGAQLEAGELTICFDSGEAGSGVE